MIAKKIKFTITAFFIFIPLYAQDLINSGPMVGYSTYEPVCGCNIQTYSNECYARKAGVTSYVDGECN